MREGYPNGLLDTPNLRVRLTGEGSGRPVAESGDDEVGKCWACLNEVAEGEGDGGDDVGSRGGEEGRNGFLEELVRLVLKDTNSEEWMTGSAQRQARLCCSL